MKIWWVLLKSDDDLVFFCSNLMSFLQIWQRFDFFCLDLVSFAQIYQRFGKKYKSPPKGTFGDIFINFDRSDQWSNKFDPTWLVGFYGRWRVFSPKTRCHRVGCELGTNPAKIRWKIQIAAKRNLWRHLCRLRPIRLVIKQIWSDMTRWFLQLVASFLVGNSMSSGWLRVGHRPDPDWPVDTPRYIHGYVCNNNVWVWRVLFHKVNKVKIQVLKFSKWKFEIQYFRSVKTFARLIEIVRK